MGRSSNRILDGVAVVGEGDGYWVVGKADGPGLRKGTTRVWALSYCLTDAVGDSCFKHGIERIELFHFNELL